MKKKRWLILLLFLLLFTTGCGKVNIPKKDNNKVIELKEKANGYTTTFTYDKNLSFSEVTVYDQGDNTSISFDNINLDLDFEMYYMNIDTNQYKETQKNRSEKKYYEEYQFGKYEAYSYGDFDNNIMMNVLLNEKEEDNTSDILVIAINRLDDDEDVVVADVIKEREVQNFLNTIKFKIELEKERE